MNYIFDFEKLLVYQKALNYVNRLYAESAKWPKYFQFTLGEHLCKTGIQMLNNIAEGSGKRSPKAKIQFYGYSLDSSRECIPMITVVYNQKIINKSLHDSLRNEVIAICQMTAKLIKATK